MDVDVGGEVDVDDLLDVEEGASCSVGRFESDIKEIETPVPFVQTDGIEEASPDTNLTAAHFVEKLDRSMKPSVKLSYLI